MHKNTKLLPYQRREVYRHWREGESATDLAKQYQVTRKTLYEVFKKAKLGVFENYSSKNLRYRTLEYGLKRLEKTEVKVKKKLKKRERRLNRSDQTSWSAAIALDEALIMVRVHQSLGNVSPTTYLEHYIAKTKRELRELRETEKSVTNA